jgi:hypothetical protein
MSLQTLPPEMLQHHIALTTIAKNYCEKHGDYYEGNIFTYDGQRSADAMFDKIINIYELAKKLDNEYVLEIGFNAGNSALVFLMANPKIKVLAYDICLHKYVYECLHYLNKNFNDRITLVAGDSLKTVPATDRSLGGKICAYHIDGWHDKEGITADLKNCYELSKNSDKPSLVIVDDCQVPDIAQEFDKYVSEGKLEEKSELWTVKPRMFPHRIGVFK